MSICVRFSLKNAKSDIRYPSDGKSDRPRLSRESYSGDHKLSTVYTTYNQQEEEQESGPPLMTREHIEECPGFAFLRAGKELIDRKEQSEFFITVMKFRSMRV